MVESWKTKHPDNWQNIVVSTESKWVHRRLCFSSSKYSPSGSFWFGRPNLSICCLNRLLVLLDANSGSCGRPAFPVNSFRCWRPQVSDFVCLRQKGEVTSCTAHLYKAWSPSHNDLCTSKWCYDSQWRRRNHRQLTMKTMKLMHEPTRSLQLLQTPFLATPESWNIDLSPSYFRS